VIGTATVIERLLKSGSANDAESTMSATDVTNTMTDVIDGQMIGTKSARGDQRSVVRPHLSLLLTPLFQSLNASTAIADTMRTRGISLLLSLMPLQKQSVSLASAGMRTTTGRSLPARHRHLREVVMTGRGIMSTEMQSEGRIQPQKRLPLTQMKSIVAVSSKRLSE
jgi:hypothetical protein